MPRDELSTNGMGDSRALNRVSRELGRELTTHSMFLHTLIASKVGLNATDLRCLDLISQSGDSLVTAGDLKTATGLTTGAVTAIIDRLEKAGAVERVRDERDRRKVFVRRQPGSTIDVSGFYEGLAVEMARLASSYTDSELKLIEGFMESNLKILKDQIARLSGS
jgi:DNA-binding MarR family transcriptional regulator